MKLKNEVNIVKKAMKYDEKAIVELFAHYQEYLYQIAYLYCKNQQDALDAVSECITKVYVSFPKLKKPEYFKTWITRILINEVLDNIRKKKRYISFEKLRDMGYEIEFPIETISYEEKMDLYQAMEQLKPDYKKALILKYFQDFSIYEIGEIMGISESSVKVLVYRGRKKLRRMLLEESIYEV